MHSVSPFLKIQSPDGEIQRKLIESDRLTVGRDSQNDIELSNEHKTIYRKHCVLECQDNSWWIVDDNPSANGTFIQRDQSKEIDVRCNFRQQRNSYFKYIYFVNNSKYNINFYI